MGFTEEGGNGTHIQIVPNMKWIPGRVKASDYYVNYDYEMWGKVQVLDKVDRRGVDSEETEVNLAIALLVTVLLIFSGYILLVLLRCYRKLWSGKRFSSAASQTEPELTFDKKEENLLWKTVLKPELPEMQSIKEPVKEKPLSNTKNPSNEDSSMQVDKVPSQRKQLTSPKSSFSPAFNNQVSGPNNNGGETFAEYMQPNKVNGNDGRLQDTPIKKSKLCYNTRSDIEDDLVLMKLKNESQICDGGVLIQASLLSTDSPRGLAYSVLDDQGEVYRPVRPKNFELCWH